MDRLRHIIIEAICQETLSVSLHGIGGHGDNRNMLRVGIRLQRPDRGPAIFLRTSARQPGNFKKSAALETLADYASIPNLD